MDADRRFAPAQMDADRRFAPAQRDADAASFIHPPSHQGH